MRLLVNEAEIVDEIGVVYGVDVESGDRRAVVVPVTKIPQVVAAISLSKVATCDVRDEHVIQPEPV